MKGDRTDELSPPGDETERLCDLYEQLRSFVLEGSSLPGQVYGLGVLLRQGMRAWMAACVEHAQLERASNNVVYKVAPCLPSSMQEELTRTLASLVLNNNERGVENYGEKFQGERKPSEANLIPVRTAVNCA
ncbi:MAG: hypothetical protein MIO92_08645, partial [Methanosarcinaceae archaeon]|nr:hypothetical protein [Methanosarcinaceae archaeon]